MQLTVVIPTKNRENDLATLIDSLLLQSKLPDEVIVVDQSDSAAAQQAIKQKWINIKNCGLVYILDSDVKGLVDAKRVGSEMAKYDLVCFLDDDLILDKHFIREAIKTFEINPNMAGSSGVFINYPKTNHFRKAVYALFHRGIFRDPRPAVFRDYSGYSNELIKTPVLWGGITVWRRSILTAIPFDSLNSLFMMEDFDYSRKVREAGEDRMFLNPNARAIHNHSLVNRSSESDQEERKIFEYMAYYKKSKHDLFSFAYLVWLLIGLFSDVLYKAVRTGDSVLLQAYLRGLKLGKKYEP